MAKIRLLSIFVICSVSLLLNGCAPRMIPAPALPPSPISAREVLAKIVSGFPQNVIFKSKARFSVDSPKGKFSTGIFLFAQRPKYLRIETISLFGLPDFILTASEKNLKIYSIREGKFYIGSADSNLSRFLPIYLNAEETVYYILGLVPPGLDQYSSLQGYIEGSLYRIDLYTDNSKLYSIWTDAAAFKPARIEKYEDGSVVYRVAYEDYRMEGDILVPGAIKFQFEKPDKIKIHLRFSSIEILKNAKVDFDLKEPAGIAPMYLD